MVRISNGGVPAGMKCLEKAVCPSSTSLRLNVYRIAILLLTFLSYTCYHMSRKPISVVKTKLLNCPDNATKDDDVICTSFINEMNGVSEEDAKRLEGTLDTTYLFSYAFFMFFSGIVAERVDLRYYLSFGMFMSGVFTMAFGAAYYLGIHSIAYFIAIQFFGGAFQTTGWPGVVTVVANWFGKGKKGLIFGIWNSHTSIGNIVGSLLAGVFVDHSWGLSFIVPGAIICGCGILFWFVLVPRPELVGLEVDTPAPEEVTFAQPAFSAAPGTAVTRTLANGSPEDGGFGGSRQELIDSEEETGAISFLGALRIPGVVEFSLCLFFAKLVSYTFLYWLPSFIFETGANITSENAAYLSTLFDVGGIVGGIFAGLISDTTGKSASTCAIMLIAAIPMLNVYQKFGENCPIDMNHTSGECYTGNVALLLAVGMLVNGPYALITTAVSAELGTHPSLRGSSHALATVTSIIDGTGSIGAAVGPFLAGSISELKYTFYMLMAADVLALILLTRLVINDVKSYCESRRQRGRSNITRRPS